MALGPKICSSQFKKLGQSRILVPISCIMIFGKFGRGPIMLSQTCTLSRHFRFLAPAAPRLFSGGLRRVVSKHVCRAIFPKDAGPNHWTFKNITKENTHSKPHNRSGPPKKQHPPRRCRPKLLDPTNYYIFPADEPNKQN